MHAPPTINVSYQCKQTLHSLTDAAAEAGSNIRLNLVKSDMSIRANCKKDMGQRLK